ncbi:hypothetical protein BWI15_17605 [Kribbella sp. ALI-6-A]|nr:hypothetical protein BWI15_17605 [Kribbella sp. ALI-6-A]
MLHGELAPYSYVFQTSILFGAPRLLGDLSLPLGAPSPADLLEINLWYGPSGNHAPLHFDTKDNYYVQVAGEKRFILVDPAKTDMQLADASSPDWRKGRLDVGSGGVDAAEIVLHPGDVLHMDPFMGHDVTAVTDSISVNFWYKARLDRVAPEMVYRLAFWLSQSDDPKSELNGFILPNERANVASFLIETVQEYCSGQAGKHVRAASDDWLAELECLLCG